MTTAAELFGVKTGQHTHPATHPWWMKFADGNCVVCPAPSIGEQQLAGIIRKFLENELTLPTRHHGQKHRNRQLIAVIQAYAPEVPENLILGWIDWAVTTCEIKVGDLTEGKVAGLLAEMITDRWL